MIFLFGVVLRLSSACSVLGHYTCTARFSRRFDFSFLQGFQSDGFFGGFWVVRCWLRLYPEGPHT